jgi:hypothetical protein
LAREPSTDEVNWFELAPDLLDVFISLHPRPILLEHSPAKWVNLNLPNGLAEPSSLQAQLETTNTAE